MSPLRGGFSLIVLHQILPLLPAILGCVLAFVAGGVVKGVISLGLPLVGMPLLLLTVDVPTAVNLLMVPLILSNLVQCFEASGPLPVIRRFWPLLICLCVGVFIGTGLFAALDRRPLLLAIGTMAMVFAGASLLQPHLVIPPRVERWLGPPVGFAAGVVGGMSTMFGPVLATFIVGLKLERESFVTTISLLYTTASTMLLVGGASHGTTDLAQIGLSALAMIPVYAGMLIGQRIRHRFDAERFRMVVLVAVLVTGASLVRAGFNS